MVSYTRNYSPLRHVFCGIWLKHDPRKKLAFIMKSYSAYFDASGHPDQGGSLFVSGYVSTEEKWIEFEAQWGALLRKYGITAPFHMKDFAPGVKQYASLKKHPAERDRFLQEAIRIIKRHVHKSISTGVSVSG